MQGFGTSESTSLQGAQDKNSDPASDAFKTSAVSPSVIVATCSPFAVYAGIPFVDTPSTTDSSDHVAHATAVGMAADSTFYFVPAAAVAAVAPSSAVVSTQRRRSQRSSTVTGWPLQQCSGC